MQHLLIKLEEERWNWAQRGVEAFKEGFLRLKHTPSEKKSVLIGVYGPTQVGKTTLILKILCIKEERFKGLSDALRGKREHGNSATITGTIYRRSEGEHFRVLLPHGEESLNETIQEFEEAMSDIRHRIENTMEYSTKPLIIEIPKSYFDDETLSKRKQHIEILDLPGDNSKEKKEIQHVNNCLKAFLPLCRVCIIMEIASAMISLSQIKRKYVCEWPYMSSRFRVVLTRSVTSSSVKKLIEEGTLTSKDSYQKFYESELVRALNDTNTDTKIFPLEFGDSWDQLKKDSPDYFKLSKHWIDETFDDFIQDLSSVYSAKSEIDEVKDLEKYAVKKSGDEYKLLEAQKTKLEKQAALKNTTIKSLQIKMKKQKQHIDDLTKEQEALSEIKVKQLKSPTLSDWDHASEQTVNSLKGDFSYHQDRLTEKYNDLLAKWDRHFRQISKACEVKHKPMNCTFEEDTVGFLDDYWTNTYLIKLNFNRDVEKCQDILEESGQAMFQQVKKAIAGKKKSFKKALQNQIKKHGLVINRVQDELDGANNELESLKNQISKKQHDIQNAKLEWEKDIERTKLLNVFLKKAFNEESEEYKRLILSKDNSPEEKWIYHQYWNIISRDVERITMHE